MGILDNLENAWDDDFQFESNPISETDLAEYMINCVEDQSKWNKVLNLGGPDDGMTMKQQGEMIFQVLISLHSNSE